MGKRDWLITGGALLLMIIPSPAAWGREGEPGDSMSLFRVNAELAPAFSGAGSPELPFAGRLPGVPFTEILNLPRGSEEDGLSLRDAGDGRTGAQRPSGIDRHYFRFSFFRSVLEQRGMDALRQREEDSDTLSKIRSLPSMLNASPRETFGVIGDIFKLQLNLEIDF